MKNAFVNKKGKYMKNFFKFLKLEKIKQKLKAFSLVEVMVSLIVISVISAAFVPVMTKKMTGKKINVTPKITLTQNCSDFTNKANGGNNDNSCGKCTFCDMGKSTQRCLLCNCNCPSGLFKDTETCTCKSCTMIDTNCVSCSSGGACMSCKQGMYLENNKCIPCPSGYYCPDGVKKIQCEKGYYCANGMSHTPCPAGTYSDSVGATASSTCKGCSTNNGNMSAAGASQCTNCGEGKYATDSSGNWGAGQLGTTCLNCPAGWYCTGGYPRPCNGGKYQNEGNKNSCKTCGAGYYSPASGAQASCGVCSTNNGNMSGAGASQCTNCGNGKYATDGSGNWGSGQLGTVCLNCPPGWRCNGGYPTACLNGYYQDSWNATSCKTCSAGWYCSGTSVGQCTAGTYSLDHAGSCTANSYVAHCTSYSTTSNTCATCENTYSLTNGQCVRNCALYPGTIRIGDYCVHATNVGYAAGEVSMPSGVPNLVPVNTAGTKCTGWNCCWKVANTSYPTGTGGGSPGYDVRYRTLCSFNAALNICAKLGGRVPTIAEANTFVNNFTELNLVTMGGTANCYGASNITGWHYYANNTYAGNHGANKCRPGDHWLLDSADANLKAANPSKASQISDTRYSFGVFQGIYFAGQAPTHQRTPQSVRCIF